MKGYIMEQITINEIQKYANELFLNIGGNVAHYSFIEYLNDLKNQEIIYDFYVIDSEDKFQYVIKFIPMAYYHQEIVDRNSVFIYKPEKIEDKQDLLYKKYNNHKTKLLPCIGLADVIEDGNKEKQKEVLEKMLGQYRGKIKNVVLRLYTLSIDSTRN